MAFFKFIFYIIWNFPNQVHQQIITNSGKMLDEIRSFDPYIVQDELLAIMQRSPQTTRFIEVRTKEIVLELISIPIIKSQEQMIHDQMHKIEQFEHERELNNDLSAKQGEQFKHRMQKVLLKNRQLEKQVERLCKAEENRVCLSEERQKLREEMNILQSHLKQEKKRNEDYMIYSEELKLTINGASERIFELEELLISKNQNIEKLQQQNQKMKKNSKTVKYNEIQIRKEYGQLKKKNEELQQSILAMENNFRNQVNGRQNQRKAVNVKLKELNRKHFLEINMLRKMQGLRSKIKELREENNSLRKQARQSIERMKENIRNQFYEIMDEIGLKMGKEIEFLILQMTSLKTQSRIYKEEVRIKEEMMSEIEKVAAKQIQGNVELRRELKAKRSEAETLKKELKRNFEQQEIKLQSLERTYRDILYEGVSPHY